jgi:hypothetical protein
MLIVVISAAAALGVWSVIALGRTWRTASVDEVAMHDRALLVRALESK